MLAKALIIFKVGLQGLTAQSTMEAELVEAALTMKEEVVFSSNIMLTMGFDKSFGSVPWFIDNTLALPIRRQPYLYSSPKAYRAEVIFFRARTVFCGPALG